MAEVYSVSKELANELKQLSGWEFDLDDSYSLSMLLRKLPEKIPFNDSEITLRLEIQWSGGWVAHYGVYDWMSRIANTPEDAAAKLAIELFKQGIIT